MCGSLGNSNYTTITHVLAPSLTPQGWDLSQDGKLWNGRNGRSGKMSHSSVGICAFVLASSPGSPPRAGNYCEW